VKWYYNETLGRCDRFWYGGSGGNDNKFDDENQCTAECANTRKTEDVDEGNVTVKDFC